jgi:acyl carrier protein
MRCNDEFLESDNRQGQIMDDLHSIERKLVDYLTDCAAPPHGSDVETDLISSGILDSLTLVDLVLYIQSEFDAILGPADVTPGNFRSVAQLARLVHHRSSSSGRSAA